MQGACARTHSYLAKHSTSSLPKCSKNNKTASELFFFFNGWGFGGRKKKRRLLWELTLCHRRRDPAAAGCVRRSWWRRGSCGSPPWRGATTGASLPSPELCYTTLHPVCVEVAVPPADTPSEAAGVAAYARASRPAEDEGAKKVVRQVLGFSFSL